MMFEMFFQLQKDSLTYTEIMLLPYDMQDISATCCFEGLLCLGLFKLSKEKFHWQPLCWRNESGISVGSVELTLATN